MKGGRLEKLAVLQAAFPHFVLFLVFCMSFLGFKTSDIQRDIGDFLEYGPDWLMVQAQRSEAKTTITAMFAVWCLIHHPSWRVLIVSAGDDQAMDIATLITRLIMKMDVLECMRPDRSAGDRVATDSFDLHHELKGLDKSASVACVGIFGNMTGKRADLLISDDIETPKNSRTAGNRQLLKDYSKEFSSLCPRGRIVYLGTPQCTSSVYSDLPQRGFAVRMWPGRYPTAEQMVRYGSYLAPLLRKRMEADPSLCMGGGLLGNQGQPVDPLINNEAVLQKVEQDQGAGHFQLHFMLNTSLADRGKYPLKWDQVITMRLGPKLPLTVDRGMTQDLLKKWQVGDQTFSTMSPMQVSATLEEPAGRHMFIDPAGGGENGDETAYSCTEAVNGTVYTRKVGGVRGGYDEHLLNEVADQIIALRPTLVEIEKNMGNGAYTVTLLPVLKKRWEAKYGQGVMMPKVKEVWHSTQKELRICDTLEPLMGSGALVLDDSVLEDDWDSTAGYDIQKRALYTLAFQLTFVTRERKALVHDDRLEAWASSVAYWVNALGLDKQAEEDRRRQQERDDFWRDPLGRTSQQSYSAPVLSTLRRM